MDCYLNLPEVELCPNCSAKFSWAKTCWVVGILQGELGCDSCGYVLRAKGLWVEEKLAFTMYRPKNFIPLTMPANSGKVEESDNR